MANELTATSPANIPAQTAFTNFVESCRSSETRSVYTLALHYFMDYLKLDRSQYNKLLDKDPKIIQSDICNYIIYLRKEKGASHATIATYVGAINKFYCMNDVLSLNLKRIKSYMGEREKTIEDRPYTHAEIQTLLTNTDRRNKAIILLMCSSGTRLGAVPLLRIRDLEPIDDYNIYKLHFYAKSKKENYHGFCTSECRTAIDEYLDYRKRWGECLSDDSPLFRVDYNAVIVKRQAQLKGVKPISKHSIRNFMTMLLLHTGLRQVPTERQTKRLGVMMTHGLRKFYETNAYRAGMDHMYIRRLIGQKSGLEDSYLKLTDEELLDGDSKHVGFIGIIDQLTIDDTQRLKKEVQTLRIDKSKMERLEQRMEEFDSILKEFVSAD